MQIGVLILVLAVIVLSIVLISRYDFGEKNYIDGYIVNTDSETIDVGYTGFQQVCDREEGYFRNISLGVYQDANPLNIISIKKKSIHCQTSEVTDITPEFFESLNCKCIEWKGKIICQDGYTLTGGYCKNGNILTNPSVLCSKFLCGGGWVVDAVYP